MHSGIPIFEPPTETKTASTTRRVREIGGKLQRLTAEGKQILVRVIGKFEKLRVREIGIPLYLEVFPLPCFLQ